MEPTSGSETTTATPNDHAGSVQGLSREIDLTGVLSSLWQSRWLITLFAAIGTVAALAYASLVPRSYIAVARIEAPSSTDLAPLNEMLTFSMGPVEAYREVVDVLHSEDFLMQVYRDRLAAHGTGSGREPAGTGGVLPRDLDRIITVRLPRNLRTTFYNSEITDIEVRHPDKGFAVQLANDLVARANATATQNTIEEVRRMLQFRLDSIGEKLQQLRRLSAASTDRTNTAAAELSAEASKPTDSTDNNDRVTADRGDESEFFSETLDDLRYQQALLTGYQTRSLDDLSLVSVYEPAAPPLERAGPGSLLLGIMGLLAGAFCGVAVALLLAARKDLLSPPSAR